MGNVPSPFHLKRATKPCKLTEPTLRCGKNTTVSNLYINLQAIKY